MKTPFFLLSSGRSGSTLLSSMLDMHPNIHIPVELWGLYTTLPRMLSSYGDLSRSHNARLLSCDLQRIGQLKEFGIRFDSERFVEGLLRREASLTAVIECFYETLLQESKKRRLGDKTPNNLPYIWEIGSVFPEAKFVHLVRDGRDCALSSMQSRTGLNYRNLYELGTAWPENNMRAAAYGKEHPENYYQIRYEDLLTASRGTVEKLCEFLEEPFAPEMLDYSAGNFARMNATVLGHHRNLGKKIISNNAAKWRTGLTADQVRVYDSLAGNVLKIFGYPIESNRDGYRWRLLRFKYRLATLMRRAARTAKSARKALWRSICIRLKRGVR